MADFKMPSLGADMESGTLTRWLVGPGDRVQRGDVVAVVDTEKSTIEVEIFQTGVVGELLVAEGAEVPVGTPLARVVEEAATAPATPPATVGALFAPGATAVAPESATPSAPAPVESLPVASLPVASLPVASAVVSPVVRRLAGRLGVDLSGVKGSGAGGHVTRADVERAAGLAAKTAGRAGPLVQMNGQSRPSAAGQFVRASPLARRLAAERGVGLGDLRGSGPGGAVTAADIAVAVVPAGTAPGPAPAPVAPAGAAPGPTPAPVKPTPAPVTPTRAPAGDRAAAMRRAIGALMARSKREIPHYYLSATADMSAATEWMSRRNLEVPVTDRLIMPVLLIAATARAVSAVPEVNGFMVDGSFVPSPAVHVGVAISLRQGGLIAPAIHDANRLELPDLMRALRDLVTRARSANLRSSEMSDPTITVTNLGDLGVESVFGVIYPPQVALVGFGQVAERPWAEQGMLGVRPCTTVTLSADHRASDGHRGGRFLAEIVRLLEHPEEL